MPAGYMVGTQELQMPRMTETRAARLKLPQDGQTFAWCSEVKGFGVRCTATTRAYIVQPRYNDRKPRINLGTVGVMPFEGPPNAPGARDLAIAALAAARRGEDPYKAVGQRKQPEGVTLADVWAAYGEAGYPKVKGIGRKRPTTIGKDADRYRYHLAQQLGPVPIARIDTPCVRRWLDRIATEGARSHALALLKSLLSFATSRGIAAAHRIDIISAPGRKVQNYLKPAELVKLDKTLVRLIRDNPDRLLARAARDRGAADRDPVTALGRPRPCRECHPPRPPQGGRARRKRHPADASGGGRNQGGAENLLAVRVLLAFESRPRRHAPIGVGRCASCGWASSGAALRPAPQLRVADDRQGRVAVRHR